MCDRPAFFSKFSGLALLTLVNALIYTQQPAKLFQLANQAPERAIAQRPSPPLGEALQRFQALEDAAIER